jgi:hypothetical protein
MKVIETAARELLYMCILDEIEDEDAGAKYPRGINHPSELIDRILKKNRDQVFYIMGHFIGEISKGLGQDLWLVTRHMFDGNEDLEIKAIYLFVMVGFGHGICILDNHEVAFEDACKKLGITPNHCPAEFDQHSDFTDPLITLHLQYPKEEIE